MPPTRSTTKKTTPSTTEPDSEVLTLGVVKELLQVQENMFKALFEATMTTVNKRIDSLITTVTELKASLEFTQKDVQEIKPNMEKLLGIERDISNTKIILDQQKNNAEYLENQSRRNNLRLDGIPEVHGETWEVTESLVKDALKDKLEITEDICIERAHRVERRARPGSSGSASATSIRPRTIVCRLKIWKQKENILKNARKIKPHGLFVNEDLAAETLQKRKAQMPKLIEAKQAGKIAYFILDKLIVRNRPVVEIK